MATTKTINTRIQLRYDTLTNWQSEATAGKGALLVLNKGEMALCYVPAINTGTTQTAPTVLFKVGDGTKTFKDLPWGGAVAADVYAWAKAPEKPTYTAAEIQGLPEDTDTQYKIEIEGRTIKLFSKDKGGNWGTEPVSTVDVPTSTLIEGTTNGAVVFNGDIVHVHGLGSAAYAETGAFDADGAANTVKTELTGAPTDTWATNKTLNAVHNEAAAAQETANKAVVANAPITGGTHTKITYDAKGLVTAGADLVAEDITSGVFDVARIPDITLAKVTDKGNAAYKNVASSIVVGSVDEGLVTAKDVAAFVKNQVAGLSGAMHFIGTSTSDPMSETGATVAGHDTFNAGDVCLYVKKEYVYTGTTWVELGDEGSYVLNTTKVNGHELKSDITLTAGELNAYTKTETNNAITTEIEKLDAAKAGGGTAQYIKSISQTDGIISAEVETMKALTIGNSGKTYDGGTPITIKAEDLGAVTDVSGKLDKFDGTVLTNEGTYAYVARRSATGVITQTKQQIAISSEPAPGQIPTYDAASRLKTAAPYAENDAANMKYVNGTIDTKLGEHAGIDKVGTVTSVAAGTGLKVTGTASVNPKVEIDDAVIFILNGGSATTVI